MFLRESARCAWKRKGGIDLGTPQVDNPTSLENVETKVILLFHTRPCVRLNNATVDRRDSRVLSWSQGTFDPLTLRLAGYD